MKMINWQSAPEIPDLTQNAIHIFRIDLLADNKEIERSMKILDQEECARAARFKFPHHRRRFVMAHAGVRNILSRYTQELPEDIIFITEDHGKPALRDFPELQFNLSHSEELALCAITLHTPLGIDVEFHKAIPDYLDIAKRFFTKEEYAQLVALPEAKQVQGFFNAWTRKEAFIKALGKGLHYPLDKFCVELDPAKCARIISIDHNPEATAAWELHDFTPAPQYTAALVLQRHHNTTHFYY